MNSYSKPQNTLFFFHASADLYGSDYVLLELVQGILPYYNATVFLPCKGPLVERLADAGAEVIVTPMAILRREHLSLLGVVTFISTAFFSLIKIARLAKKKKAIIFHTNTAAVWSGFLAALLARKPHVWQVMEIIEKPTFVSWLISKSVGLFSNQVFCISSAVKQHFIKYNAKSKDKFSVLYHGVDRNIYDKDKVLRERVRKKLLVNDDTIVVGFAGRFNAWKGQEILAKSALQIVEYEKAPNLHFLFLGDIYGDNTHHLEELRNIIHSSSKLSKQSTIEGFKEDFQNWLGAMDILVLPSKNPEPNATVTIAAMTMGIPMIGTNIGGTTEAIEHEKTGFLIEPNNVDALSEAILKLAKTPKTREKYSVCATSRATKMFSMKNYVNTLLECYKRLSP